MARDLRSCAVCRFMRAMAFSAIGGGVAGYLALTLGMDKTNAIVVAFFGALGAVVFANRKKSE
ncbi:MAG: hypothetical protein GY934_16325 [Gammaproteobacteria bacterium]|nr:hypothetical protein [Gammaproteobacteria bacterium]